MNNDIEALKYLYSQMGGADDVSQINTSTGMIAKIGDIVASGGGSGSAGGDTVLVEIADITETDSQTIYSLNKTPAELWPEIENGKTIILKDSRVNGFPIYCTGFAYRQGGMIFGDPFAFMHGSSTISDYFQSYNASDINEPYQLIVNK